MFKTIVFFTSVDTELEKTAYTTENETIYQNLNLKFHVSQYRYMYLNLALSQNTHIVYIAGVSMQGVAKMVFSVNVILKMFKKSILT